MANLALRAVLTSAAVLLGAIAHAQVPIGRAPGDSPPSGHLETVPFVTSRAIERRANGVDYYGALRGPLSAGRCSVDLHARKKHEVVGLEPREVADVVDGFMRGEGRVVVYVHGYNVSFEQACREAARFQHNLKLEERLLLFSWPAQAKLMGYVGDIGDVEWTVVPLESVLAMLVERYGPRSVDVVGHSLGARAVFDAIVALGRERGAGTFGRVIFIAPDLDTDMFVRDYGALSDSATAVSVYVSAQDRALKASRDISDQPRLGEGGARLAGLPRLDVVDVVQWRWRWGSRHDYHLRDADVIDDLAEVLSGPPHASGSRSIGD